MPELPEVETIRRGLNLSIKDKEISHAETMRPNLRIPFPIDFCERLEGQKITKISRRSKYLLITLDSQDVWIIHLGMSGKVTVLEQAPEQLAKHDHVMVEFTDGSVLLYNDARRFGLMDLCKKNELNDHTLFKQLGPEPLTDNFNIDYFRPTLLKKHTPIKNTIMDSHVVVGVGNIYACESLFRSKISPTRNASSLNKKETDLLIKNIKDILTEAIASGGSTLRDYVQSSGEMGYFQHRFSVYGREGEDCITCRCTIQRIKQQGRSTFFCTTCQK